MILRATRLLLLLGALCCIISWLIIVLFEVESVLVTGPILTLIGLLLVLFGLSCGRTAAALVGAAHLSLCLFLFALVNLLDWSPGEALLPFTAIGVVYVLVIVPLSWHVRRQVPARLDTPGQCEQCGYLLYGLTEPRCPECGRPFDSRLLRSLAPPSHDSRGN